MDDGHLHIAVLMGGMSLEHEVSLRSGAGVARALTATGYQVLPVTIQKNGQWEIAGGFPVSPLEGLVRLRDEKVDGIFIALHGANGEDGRIQGLLDTLGMPYTGSGCAASALSMDKLRAKAVVNDAGIRTARHFSITHDAWHHDPAGMINRALDSLGFPLVIKAPCQGSSCGLAIVHNPQEFQRDVNEIMPLEGLVMAEAFIKGLEVTCAVLDLVKDGRPQALPVTEIRPNESAYFDYYSKYTPGATHEITPAHIGDTMTARVQEMAVAAHVALGCASWSRSDFILGDDGPVWLEVNTLPGLTETSLFPQAAAARGITYESLIQLLVHDALARHAAHLPKE